MKVIQSFRMDNGNFILCENKTYEECVKVILKDIGDKEYKKINNNMYAISWIRYIIEED